ncbi:hypothetical protein FD22_GL001101 [Loigolactobacillus coryniformis subsp. coryniformis KCTC 3167 = DSM 20001]|uniref:Uncharacterized protein n=1 Tax=Loigolactobacillus coryniformis subsp. coryniformis KCTC 3167 = DSM 20001 TaxID=913848 RepID=A0A0R1FBU7_9LACO|nr:hypothetical protein FD22_GL001101 [Loigolactobacillus coryniformis subsp. coryniformis KCTC 3167 = DSM 20001]
MQKYADILELKLSTLILLTENNEKLDKEGKSKLMIRKLMLKLISKTAGGE